MLRRMHEVLIRAQQNNIVPDADLRDQRIDCAYLPPALRHVFLRPAAAT